MKIFLFYVNAIIGLDDWTDRKLIFQVDNLIESEDKLCVTVNTEEPINFRKLTPMKSYALQFEHPAGQRELKYYMLKAFEVEPDKDTIYKLILHVKRIEVEA